LGGFDVAFQLFPHLGHTVHFARLGNLSAKAQQINKVFVIAMENHNWTQPDNQFTNPKTTAYPATMATGLTTRSARSSFLRLLT